MRSQKTTKAIAFVSFIGLLLPTVLANAFNLFRLTIFIPAKAMEYVFTGVGLSVCLSVTTITKKIVDGFVPNFMGRFLGGKGRPSSCFVTIGRGMWK